MIKIEFESTARDTLYMRDAGDGTPVAKIYMPQLYINAIMQMQEEARQHRADGIAKAAGLYGDELKSVFDELMSSGNVVVQIIPAEQFLAATERAEDERDDLQKLNDQLAAEAPPLHMRPDIPLPDSTKCEWRSEQKSNLPTTPRERVEEILWAHGFDPRFYLVPLHDVPAPDCPRSVTERVVDGLPKQMRDKLKDEALKAALSVVNSPTETPQRAKAMGELRRALKPFDPSSQPDY